MPTVLPKVQGYVSQAVFDKLNEFKDARGLKSISQALTAALDEFFGITVRDLLVNQSEAIVNRLESLEEQLLALRQKVASLESESNYKLISESNQLPIVEVIPQVNYFDSLVHSESKVSQDDLLATSDLEVNQADSLIRLQEALEKGALSESEGKPLINDSEGAVEDLNLENREYTAKELATLLGISDRAVTAAAEKGQECFREWSKKFGKGTWDFKMLDRGEVNKFRRYFRAME